jgi:hypothetical protein
MNSTELETKVKTLEDEVRTLRNKLSTLEEIEKIKELQRIYGYYLDSLRYDDVIDLFSDSTESLEISSLGIFHGKEGVRRFFNSMRAISLRKPESARGLSLHMMLQGVVHLDPSGETARGRWQCFMCLNLMSAGGPQAAWGHGVFENNYIKEDGKWMFKRLRAFIAFQSPYDDGWLKSPLMGRTVSTPTKSDIADEPYTEGNAYLGYPSGYVIPFHYKHPITGK